MTQLAHLAEEVHKSGVAFIDGELTLVALSGLYALYNAFVTTQTARADEITFAAFHEVRYSRPSSTAIIPMANVASSLATKSRCIFWFTWMISSSLHLPMTSFLRSSPSWGMSSH